VTPTANSSMTPQVTTASRIHRVTVT